MRVKKIDTPADALLYVDFLARFGTDSNLVKQMRGIATVIRRLARTTEEQALVIERMEASNEKL